MALGNICVIMRTIVLMHTLLCIAFMCGQVIGGDNGKPLAPLHDDIPEGHTLPKHSKTCVVACEDEKWRCFLTMSFNPKTLIPVMLKNRKS